MLLDPRDIFIEIGDGENDDGQIGSMDGEILFNDGDDGEGNFSNFFISELAVEALVGDIIFQA